MGISRADYMFRVLRKQWFRFHLYIGALEGESEEAEKCRKLDNDKLRTEYDRQTDRLLTGNNTYEVAPRYSTDIISMETDPIEKR